MAEVTESPGQLRSKNRTAGGIPDTEARRKITPKLYRRSIGSVCAGIPTVIPEADTVLCPSNRYAGGYTAFWLCPGYGRSFFCGRHGNHRHIPVSGDSPFGSSYLADCKTHQKRNQALENVLWRTGERLAPLGFITGEYRLVFCNFYI